MPSAPVPTPPPGGPRQSQPSFHELLQSRLQGQPDAEAQQLLTEIDELTTTAGAHIAVNIRQLEHEISELRDERAGLLRMLDDLEQQFDNAHQNAGDVDTLRNILDDLRHAHAALDVAPVAPPVRTTLATPAPESESAPADKPRKRLDVWIADKVFGPINPAKKTD